MRYSPHLLDEIRARLPVSQVVGRKVALKKKGREYAGLSPFKVEKTPSFFVNDQKGFYHCFASGEHGDIFTFLMKTEGLSFPETVERLAEEAGVTLPKPDQRDERREDERQRLTSLLETSAKFFEQALASSAGAEARGYIDRRGLKRDTVTAFRLGFAPNSRSALTEHLKRAGYTVPEMVASGMLIGGEDIREPYDRFRNRVMFPIADARGRIVAFGGRALDPDQPAKYLNSPETPLFHKGNLLFNLARARGPAHDRDRLVVVEGYMDVIALTEAGVAEAVAPLGTALTEEQVGLLWRLTPEPIMCFDGDGAGRRAAWRAIDTALPLLKPGASLMFAFLPDGLDPDDLVRQQGAAALEPVLARARPLIDVLFERELAAGDWSTPERRARLEQQLRTLVARIADPTVRGHYEREVRQRLFEMLNPAAGRSREPGRRGAGPRAAITSPNGDRRPRPGQPQGRGAASGFSARPTASASLRSSALVLGEAAAPPYREALLLLTLLNHPWLLEDESEAIAALPLSFPPLAKLRDGILSAQAFDNSLDSQSLRSHLSRSDAGRIVDLVERSISHKCDRFARPDADRAEVADGWRHALALHERHVGLKRSLDAAERAWHEDRSEVAYARIRELQRQLEHLVGVEGPESAAAIAVGPSGRSSD